MADPGSEPPDSYLYRPLDPKTGEFRLLALKPGKWSDDIECTLQYSNLDGSPGYDALSYVWGSDTNKRPIRLDGVQVFVTANLETALRHLRFEAGTGVLWVDSLCINQKDVQEKGSQVQKMFDIYSSASHVLAWTGEASDDSDEALKLIDEFTDFLSVNEINSILNSGGAGGKSVAAALADLGFDIRKQNWDAYWTFLDRPYWSRVWILQELACRDIRMERKPCTILCGRSQIEKRQFVFAHQALSAILHAGGTMRGEFDEFDGPMKALVQRITSKSPRGSRAVQLLFDMYDKPLSLPRLLSIVTPLDATDDRDKLYSLLGLVSSEDRAVTPDYTMNTAQVMAEYVKFFVRRDRKLSFAFSNRRVGCPTAPSWTPEIHAEHNIAIGGGMSGQFGHFWAGGKRDADVEFLDLPVPIGEEGHGLVMRAKGVVIGAVEELITAWNWQVAEGDDPVSDRQGSILAWSAALQDFAHEIWNRHGSERYEIFWRTLILDTVDLPNGRFVSPAPDEMGRQSKYYFGLENLPYDFHPELPEYDRLQMAVYRFVLQWQGAMHGRTFFSTTMTGGEASMGLGPYTARPGDLAVVLHGLDRCLILRQRDKGRDDQGYIVLGDAYVHGAMRGELVEETEGKETVFDLY